MKKKRAVDSLLRHRRQWLGWSYTDPERGQKDRKGTWHQDINGERATNYRLRCANEGKSYYRNYRAYRPWGMLLKLDATLLKPPQGMRLKAYMRRLFAQRDRFYKKHSRAGECQELVENDEGSVAGPDDGLAAD